MQRLKYLIRWLNLGVIILTLLSYLSPYISPATFWFFNFLGMAYPWLLLANIAFVLIWAFRRNRYFLFSFVCILIGWNHFTSFVGLHFMSSSPMSEGINIVSFNTQGLRTTHHSDISKRESKTEDFLQFIQQNGKIDIFCTQEVNHYSAKLITEKMKFPYQYKIPYVNTALFSHYPIIEKGRVDFGKTHNSCVWIDIQLQGQKVRVYNVHLQSNRVSKETDQVMTEGQLQEKETWTNIRSIFGKIKNNSKIRVTQATTVMEHIRQCPHPVILCGDFNETPLSHVYRILSQGFQDSFRQRGFGLGTTYAGNIPALRIDYILADSRFRIVNTETWKDNYSDHYPVWSQVELKPAQ